MSLPSRQPRVDLLQTSDEVERLLDDAQAEHLNGYPRAAQDKLRDAIRLLDRLADDAA